MMDVAPRPRRRRIATAGLAVTTALGLLLAGCSGDEDDPFDDVDTSRPTATPGATGAAGGGAATPGVPADAKVPSGGRKVPAATLAKRISDAAEAADSVRFEMVSSGQDQMGGTGAAEGTGTSSRMQIDARVAGGRVRIVKDGRTVFLKSPSPIGGKPWLKIVPGSSDPFARVYDTAFAGLASAGDVIATSEHIARMGTFRVAAREPVDGVGTTKYMAAPEASIGVMLLPSAYQALPASALEQADTTVSLWVDDSGLLRRSTVVFTVKGQQATQTLVSYQDWGEPVTISPPPASQTTSGAQLSSP